MEMAAKARAREAEVSPRRLSSQNSEIQLCAYEDIERLKSIYSSSAEDT